MLALICGLAAAIAWALHDLLVRKISQNADVLPLIFVVVATGTLALVLPTAFMGGWERMQPTAYYFAMAAGLTFVAAMLGLYSAFKHAPVRIVAPIVGSYPMISLGLAVLQGRSVSLLEWLAVAAIVAGIGVVAVMSGDEDTATNARPGLALGAAFAAMLGFAATFAMGQEAARQGAEVPSIFITRLTPLAVLAFILLARRTRLAGVRRDIGVLALMGMLDAFALAMVMAAASLPHPEYAAVAASLFGVLTIVLAWRILGERVSLVQWAGICVIFGAVAVLSVSGQAP